MIPTAWVVSMIALWVLVLIETGLLLLLLRALGQLRQQGTLSTKDTPSIATWGLNVGEPAPSFTAIDQYGKRISFADFSGQKRILAFISPNCSVCAGAIEAMNGIIEQERGIAVIAVGDIDRERNNVYAAEYQARMPVLTPAFTAEKDLYRVQGIPFVFAIDEAGIIRAKGVVNERGSLRELLASAFAPVPVA